MLERAVAEKHVSEWIAAWNANDVERVLELFDPDFELISPKAQLVVGKAALKGRREIGDYWRAALAKLGRVDFGSNGFPSTANATRCSSCIARARAALPSAWPSS